MLKQVKIEREIELNMTYNPGHLYCGASIIAIYLSDYPSHQRRLCLMVGMQSGIVSIE